MDLADIERMLSESLDASRRRPLQSLLRDFSVFFDAGDAPQGTTRKVFHHMRTDGMRPLRQQPYSISPSGRGIIKKEVDIIWLPR